MDFPKKQAQRLMPLYLLEYSEKLFTNHPDPSAPWGGGGGGSDYTAGQGITITNNEISVDTNVIATKSDLPDFTKYYYVNNVIEENGEYFTKINGSGLEYSHPWSSRSISINVKNAELEDKASIVVENTGGNKIVISDRIDVYNDGLNTGVSVEGNKVVIDSHQHITSLEDGKLVYDELGQVREFNLPITNDPRTYTLATEEWVQTRGYLTNTSLDNYALKTDIPTEVSQLYNDAGYATETWVQNQGYATSSEIPTNYVTTDTAQTITGLKTIGQTDGTISEVDFSGFTFKLSNKAINHPEAEIKISNASYDGNQHPHIYSTKGLYVNLAKIRLGDDGSNTYGIKMPDSSTWESDRVLATTSDIPSLNGYATQTWVQEQGYATSSSLATVATTGNYNDLTDKPTIPTVNNPTITFTQGGATKGTITLNQSADQTIEFDAGASLPDSPFLKVDDPQDQMFFSLDGSDSSWYKYVNLSATPNRMFHVNLSALNPVFKDGLTSTYNDQTNQLEVSLSAPIPDTTNFVTTDTNQAITGFKQFNSGTLSVKRSGPVPMTLTFRPNMFIYIVGDGVRYFKLPTGKSSGTADAPTEYTLATTDDIPSTATSTSTSTVTPTTGTFVTGTSTNTTNVVNSVTYTPSSETLTFTYEDNTTASFTFLTSNTTVTSGTTSVVSSVTDSTSNAMTGATVSTSTTTTLS